MEYITYMATQKPQILLTIDDNLLRRIDDFRFNTRVNSRSEAIRQLIEEGLKNTKSPKQKRSNS
jgi:metal-responsive CopG/Arc/MetJ family transcriptional regulator